MDHRIGVEHCWMLLLLTWLQDIECFPHPRGELGSILGDSGNSRELRPDKGNRLSLQSSNSYRGSDDNKLEPSELNYYLNKPYYEGNKNTEINNEDMSRDIEKTIQEVFYPGHPTISESSDISFPEHELPTSKENNRRIKTENSFIYGGQSNFYDSKKFLNQNILQARHKPYLNNRLLIRNRVNSPSNNELLKNILDLKGIDLNKISLKTALLNKSETYNISETEDENNFLIEKKVNVTTNLKFLNSDNEISNFTDFHSSILKEKVKSGNKNSFIDPEPKNHFFKNYHTTEIKGTQDNTASEERLSHNDFVGGQFIDGDLLGARYPGTRNYFEEPNENELIRIPDREMSGLDFVGGQFVGYNKEFFPQLRTPQNDDLKAGIQPGEFVSGQFVGEEDIHTDKIVTELTDESNAATTIESSSVENKAISFKKDDNEKTNKELNSLSFLGVTQNTQKIMSKDDIDKGSTDSVEQQMSKQVLSNKITKEPDHNPSQNEHNQKFNKGISKPLNIDTKIINESGEDEALILNDVEDESLEVDTVDIDSYKYSTVHNSINNNSFEEEITSTESTTSSSENFDYEDYSEGSVLGSIVDNENKAKEPSDEIEGQPLETSPDFIGTTKEAIGVIPLDGFSSDTDFHPLFQETSTQAVKDVYLYGGKDYKNNLLEEIPEMNDQALNSNAEKTMTKTDMKENYLTEICFPLYNKKEISLFDLLTGNIYLENNGKKIALSLVKNNPMKNCTSSTTSCKLYVDVKNISHSLNSGAQYQNEEENSISRDKRQSKTIVIPLLKNQLKQNKSELIENKAFENKSRPLNLFPFTSNSSLSPLLQNEYAIERFTDKSKNEPFKEYGSNHKLTTIESQSRTKRSARDSDSCGCSNLFKSTQIPSYKYFVNKRFDILTNIVVAAKHFKDS